MHGLHGSIIGFLALVGIATAAAQDSGGGPVPGPVDDNREIGVAHQRAVANAQALGLAAVSRSSFQRVDFPLRLMPVSPSARPNAIGNFVDLDPTTNILDFSCGNRTYDGHRGTDLSLGPFAWTMMQNQEVEIIAAAAGSIVDKHDGEFDMQCAGLNVTQPANYVTILQDDGAYAFYFHMMRGTPTSKPIGSLVAKGEHLGFVGSSGKSTGPHLHFELRDVNGTTIDPFAGTCGASTTLWKHQWMAQLDPHITTVATSNAAPAAPPSCQLTDTPNYADIFQPGNTVYAVAAMRDQSPGVTLTFQLLRPDGSVFGTAHSGSPPAGQFYSQSYWYQTFALPAGAPTGTWKLRVTFGNEQLDHAFFVGTQPSAANLNPVSAILPASRSVQVGSVATVFSSIINPGSGTAYGCWIAPQTPFDGDFLFQTVDPLTNAPVGTANASIDIAAGKSQSFVLAFTPHSGSSAQGVTVTIQYKCTNSTGVVSIEGVNTLLLTFDPNPVPDMIAIGLTPSNDGFAHTGGPSGTGVFAIASANIGASAQITARVRLSNSTMPINSTICQTNPNTGQCLVTPAPTVTTTINQNQNTTWGAFLQATGAIAPDPANFRAFVEFLDANGIVRGSTSTAVTTQ
jgi:murein DD-endopeptidase MepM/ murein hydrolase activator NlpD